MEGLDALIDRLKRMEQEKQSLGRRLRDLRVQVAEDSSIHEDDLIHTISDESLDDITVAGVDGGIVKKALHGIDVVMTRAAAALFRFTDGSLTSHRYLPHNRTPEITPLLAVDDRTFQITAALLRMHKELDVAIAAAQEQPDVVLLDGSIVPTYLEEPDEEIESRYDSLLRKYQELYTVCQEHNVLLAGIVEDSRGKRFAELVAEHLSLSVDERQSLQTVSDTTLLHYTLANGERTCLFNYYAHDERKQGEQSILSFYIRNVQNDIPLRIEFLGMEDYHAQAAFLASMLYATSRFNSRYGIPPVLIEADQRAKLTQNDADLVASSIQSRVGMRSSIRDLRRNRRPF